MSAANSIQRQTATGTHTSTSQASFGLLAFQAFTAAVLLAALVACGLYLVQAQRWHNQTFPGFKTAYTLVVDGNTSFGGEEWHGIEAGLRRLDRITAVNGVELPTDDYAAARQQLSEVVADLDYGNVISLRFLRPAGADGTVQTSGSVTCQPVEDGYAPCRVAYNLAPLPISDLMTYFVLPYLSGIFMLVIGIGLFFLRTNQPNALLIAVFSAAMAVFSAGTFNNSTTYFALPIWLIATSMTAATAYLIALTFPTRPTLLYRYPWLAAVPVVFFGGVAAYDLYLLGNLPTPYDFPAVWQIPVGLGILSLVSVLGSLLVRRRFAISNIYRDQINTSLAGVGVAAIPVLLWMMSTAAVIAGTDVPLPFNSATVMPFFVAIPMSMAYAVLQYRGFDTDQVLSKGLGYVIMLVALVAGYAVLVFGINMLALEVMPADLSANPFIVGIVVFFIAVAFLPVRTHLQNEIDRIYFRERRAYQDEVEAFISDVTHSQNFVEILHLYTDRVKDIVGARSLFIFLPDEETGEYVAHAASSPATDIRFGAKCDLVDLLRRERHPVRISGAQDWHPELIPERTRLNILKANLIIGLRGSSGAISGFVIVGAPQAQRDDYTYEETRFLANVTRQMSISVERSQVVESLERRVNELDVLGQVSQAVNFAVEFDDLLELISAQTQRLIDAEHFYIALRDPSTNQMYYAFFLEFNERLRERENRRWNMGNDLFARILENAKSERYDDYEIGVRMMNLNSRGIDEEVTAWMGVPLIAGQTHLGVMAAGTSQQGFTYTDDQLKIFGDIGALAATSLDKARLFEETNERARQLRALNDISRQLQAERDIERLLELVTSSAVDILGAEAGSLLLTAEENTGSNTPGDLEFRVVVGGSGEDLIGKRVQAGHGLVGEVATSGKPVIVNDTQEDKRWGGEVAQSPGFNTNAVLAVPLMANNMVIGVLEVLNKKDGSLYVKEDADVLETFAGQAAIAIDNVRLFQKTDEQLSARVQELETLERIDAELNRALDMNRVAEITVKWSIANTGAAAGMLGLVQHDEELPVMRVLAIYGYADEDYPEGALNDVWPLDRGIVKRVMRTKRADIQADTNLDPDYVTSLKGGNSQITVPMLAGGEIIAILVLEKNTEPRLNLLDLAFVQRLTDHAAIALENARLYGELSQASKMQSTMMGIGAHELRNALTPVKSWADFLLNKALGDINEQQANSLNVIKRNVGRAELIIQDLRDFAKMRANELRVEPEPISFRNVVIETLRPFTSQIEEKEQQLVNNVSEDLPFIMGDSDRLIQVMTNFISNANKYSPNGATITLDAQIQDGKEYLQISISDTGLGISEEDQQKMFQPYFRSTNEEAMEKPGTGLGMYLTREIIRQHGGGVWLESELGEGTSFYFTVPLAPEEELTSEPASD